MDEALARLAAAAGLEFVYWDGLGTRRELGEATARGLLAALGYAPEGDLVAQHAALVAMQTEATLPPVLCVPAEMALVVELAVPVEHAGVALAWRVVCEDGAVHSGESACEAAGEQARDGAGARVRGRLHCDFHPLLAAGYHRLELPGLDTACVLLAVPERCHLPPALAQGERCWGLAVQLYALRSARNWGMGDFGDLRMLATLAGAAGADFLGLNPLHARHLVRPDDASPYAPSSRQWLDALYLDIEAIAGFADCAAARAQVESAAFRARLAAARAQPLVDHAAIAGLKLPVLRALFDDFQARIAIAQDDSTVADYRAFVAAGGEALRDFAVFEAMRLARGAADRAPTAWRTWPAELRAPGAPGVPAFASAHAAEVEFHCWLQWQADAQLAACARAARGAGMRIGLYRDLAVGASDDGAEAWSAGPLIAAGASVGAPPDLLNREGQDWGLPPWRPAVLAACGYAPWRAVLAANMRHAGALRIDHVMALTRLFWIPVGMKGLDGGYVRNALEALLGVVAIESRRRHCLVIGEDLGSVPDGLREVLAARGLLSYRVLIFERHWAGDGSFKRPWEYPAQALATVVTHDMPTIAEYWAGGDIPRRNALGLFPDPGFAAQETARRDSERDGLVALIEELDLRPVELTPSAVAPALHASVARSHALLAAIQLDDVLGESEPINIPGTWREYPNWRRKLALPLEALAADPRWCALVEDMRQAGRARGVELRGHDT